MTEGEDGDGEHEAFEDEPTRAKGDKPLSDETAGDDLPHGDLPHDELPHGDLPHDDELTTVHEPRPDESARLVSIVESLLFAADKPLTLKSIGDLLGETDLGKIRAAVASVEEAYAPRGVQLHSVAGGYQFRTNADNASWVQKLLAQNPVRLTRAQLETLAIVAYRQPITRPEIDQIRGVDSGGTLKTLMDRLLLRILGKKEEPGRPMLYGTTREFLEFFNLGDLKDLPTLREFHELSEEHQAQVAALESVAPEGSVDGPDAPPSPSDAPPPLQRVEIGAGPADDSAELDEIDRLIATADSGPAPPKPDAKTDPKPED
ncbi:MAG TPA: SMC-Scp complex subunit ScpB [Polyangia bacterium]|nr:SMC-Scp complex subunit ScpB [Polyangia bacterium]